MRRPLGVTLIVLGQWIGVAAGIAMGVAVLCGWRGLEGTLGAGAERFDLFSELGKWTALVLFLVSAIQAFFALAFARLQNWARVLLVVVLLANAVGDAVVLVFYAIYNRELVVAVSSLVKLPLSVAIAWYLSRPRVKDAFAADDAS